VGLHRQPSLIFSSPSSAKSTDAAAKSSAIISFPPLSRPVISSGRMLCSRSSDRRLEAHRHQRIQYEAEPDNTTSPDSRSPPNTAVSTSWIAKTRAKIPLMIQARR